MCQPRMAFGAGGITGGGGLTARGERPEPQEKEPDSALLGTYRPHACRDLRGSHGFRCRVVSGTAAVGSFSFWFRMA